MGNEAREISRAGVGYLSGSSLRLRAVTTRNRTLKTNEVQAAAACFDCVYLALEHKHRNFLNKLGCLRACMLHKCNI